MRNPLCLQFLLTTSIALFPLLSRAAITFTAPVAGTTLQGGGTIEITWGDDGTAPTIADLTTYQLFICAGGNTGDSYTVVSTVTTTGQFVNGNQAQAVIGTDVGASLANAYFVKMVSTATAGGTLTSYSTRFSLSGMTGKFTPNVIAGITALAGSTAGPQGINAVVGAQPAAGTQTGAFDVPWSLQTGPTIYAPMQPIPPDKITMKKKTPLYPTSAVTLASTFMGLPVKATTVTQSQTASYSQKENDVAAAAMPTDDMQRFLNRWKD